MLALQKQCETYAKSGALTWRKKTRVDEITMDPATGAVSGVRWTTKDGTVGFDSAKSVVLATGGFANDREGPDSLLRKHAPDSTRFATTNTKGTTGDGHKLAFGLGAQGVDMANVQIHPTGFVDPNDPKASTKTLAAEILRGAGGLLLTRDGRRFADELGTRDYVSGRMLAEAKAEAAAGGLEVGEDVSLDFALVLNDAGAREADKHVPLYTQKGLLREFDTVEDLAAWLDDELRAKDREDTTRARTPSPPSERRSRRTTPSPNPADPIQKPTRRSSTTRPSWYRRVSSTPDASPPWCTTPWEASGWITSGASCARGATGQSSRGCTPPGS